MSKNSILQLLRSSSERVDPLCLLKSLSQERLEADAYLFLGKVSERFFEALQTRLGADRLRKKPILGIFPKTGGAGRKGPGLWPGIWIEAEHPLPGEGSFRAGSCLLEFIDLLRRTQVKRLNVFLSGGASSLMWLPRSGVSHEALLKELRSLYRAGLDIRELNRQRSRLCQLKAGGAARWLHCLAPSVKAQVFVLSDVAPWGPELVGSGPFWDDKVPHRVLADNATWVSDLAREIRQHGLPVLHCSSGRVGSWQSWVQSAIREVAPTLRGNGEGVFIFGGEPSVRLPAQVRGKKSQKGGRQTHLALALAQRLRPWLLKGKIEILAMSSDGSDGNSGAAGVWIDSNRFPKRFAHVSEESVKDALRKYRSAVLLSKLDALVKADDHAARSNVQDVLMIRIR